MLVELVSAAAAAAVQTEAGAELALLVMVKALSAEVYTVDQ